MLLLCNDMLLFAQKPATSYSAQSFDFQLKNARAGNAKAMNAVAIYYNLGLGGITKDHEEAVKWFRQSGENGYPAGWYNLGLKYKEGNGVEQDFKKAYQAFCKASDAGLASGHYARGYSLYKGYGCKQDYAEAIKFFRKGLAKGNWGCMYLLGLCYRNGYGIEVNIDSARFWLQKASLAGYHFATDELYAPAPEYANVENKSAANSVQQPANSKQPEKFERVKHFLPAANIAGTYNGYLIRYDWSGQHIISKSKLTLTLSKNNDILNGLWIEDDSLRVNIRAGIKDSAVVFSDTKIEKKDHYHTVEPKVFEFRDARLQLVKQGDTVFLAGDVQLYSLEDKEPGRPTYISLVRNIANHSAITTRPSSEQEMQDKGLKDITPSLAEFKAYPNPFNKSLKVSFLLAEPAEVKITLTDMNGKTVYSSQPVHFKQGMHEQSIEIPFTAGAYLLRLGYGKEVKTTVVIKN